MMQSEKSKEIKKQLIEQINSTFPDESKNATIEQIEKMNDEQLEEFLKQNNIISKGEEEQCLFCSIIENKISSLKIDENEEALAILEINPISKGHLIVIPKAHTSEAPKGAYDLAEKLSIKLSQIFNPKKVEIVPSNLFGHEIVNVFSIYNNETIHTKRLKTNQEELKELQKEIVGHRSEERRVGKECRSRWSPYH